MLDRTRIRTDVWEIHANGDTLIFGRTAALLPVPKDIRGYRIALQVLNRMIRNHEAARQIRAAYLEWSSRHLAKDLSEAEILRLVEDDIAHHRISVIALPHVYLNALASKSSAAKGGTRRAHILSAMAGRTAPSAGPAGLNAPEPPKKPVIQWELTDKFIWVFKRTAKAKVGPEIARMLMEMIKPEKLAEMLVITEVLAQVTLAANTTPVGWVWDLALAGIAYYFGGLAALEALKDVMIFLIRTIRAQTESDLETASEALARAALALTAAGLMVLLHKIAARKGTGSPGGGEEPPVVTKGAGGGKTGEPPSSRRPKLAPEETSANARVHKSTETPPKKPVQAKKTLADAFGTSKAAEWTAEGRARASKNGVDVSHLSDDEIGSLYGYTTNEGYQALNPALRGERPMTPELKAVTDNASSALDKLPPYQGTSLRGTSLPADVLAQHQPGQVVEYKAFTSSSLTSPFEKPIKMEIQGQSGRDIAFLSEYPEETEILFKPNTKFEVTGRQTAPDGKTFIQMREVSQ